MNESDFQVVLALLARAQKLLEGQGEIYLNIGNATPDLLQLAAKCGGDARLATWDGSEWDAVRLHGPDVMVTSPHRRVS